MTHEPERRPGERRVYLSASNHFFLALKAFGYSLLGYLLIAIVILVIAAILGYINTASGG